MSKHRGSRRSILASASASAPKRLVPARPADKVPQERGRAVPPRSEIQALRTPATEAVFAEFRAQLAAGKPGLPILQRPGS